MGITATLENKVPRKSIKINCKMRKDKSSIYFKCVYLLTMQGTVKFIYYIDKRIVSFSCLIDFYSSLKSTLR